MYTYVKRWYDLLVSAFALVLLSPILIPIVVWIKLSSPGPVMYRGLRVGRGGVPFYMLKFRTMVVDADKLGASSTSADDLRLTRVGRFLRARKLDELPQLLNVVRGEMSLVGPRPQVQWAVDLYTSEERHLLDVRPGITDYASIKFRNEGEILRGSSDPDRDYMIKIAPGKMRFGLEYVRTYSLLVDLKILSATMMAVLGRDPEWCLPRAEHENGAAPLDPSSSLSA